MKSKSKKVNSPKVLNKTTVFFDVDETLIFNHIPYGWEGAVLEISHHGWTHQCVPNEEVTAQLKQHKKSGASIIVWSLSGVEWAEQVVKALQLEEFVDVVTGKPDVLYDDMSPTDWLPAFIRRPLPKGFHQKMSGMVYDSEVTETKEDEHARKFVQYAWKRPDY